MNKEAQRIAIAEACGWKITNGYLAKGDMPFVHVGTLVTTWEQLDRHDLTSIPDYLNDLNAMHEAEKSRLTTMGERGDYVIQLGAVVDKAGWKDHNFMITHATAAQRAEAFLRTLGLWKDDA